MTRVLVCGGRNFGAIPDDCPWESLRSYRERAERAYEDACSSICDEQACNGFTCRKGIRAVLATKAPHARAEKAVLAATRSPEADGEAG